MGKLEIERKFLLKSLPIASPEDSIKIEQFYLKRGKTWERVRSWTSLNTHETKYIHTIKKSISKGVNMEDEKIISQSEFSEFRIECLSPGAESKSINKTRHIFKNEDGLYWEIDEFHSGYHLIVAEIEIPKKTFKIKIPEYISDLILLEVTGLKKFSNRNLSIKIVNI